VVTADRRPVRGEVWWAVADKQRPVVVVQADFLNRSQMQWILAVPLTTNLTRAEYPGNVRLARRASGLRRESVANVAQVAPLHRSSFGEVVRPLPRELVERISDGLRLVLAL
jgi:mRNA interferase MazF